MGYHFTILDVPYRDNLCRNIVMSKVFERMCDQGNAPGATGRGSGVLQPWNNCFRNLDILKDHCDVALTGRAQVV